MSVARSVEEFEAAAAGLPFRSGPPDLSAEVVCVEPIDAAYFRDAARRQRCVARDARGAFYVAYYD